MGSDGRDVPAKELPELSIVEASALIRRRAISPVELVRAQLDRIAALDVALHAFVAVADDALETATRADAEIGAGEWRGPLHGIPFAVKDLIDVGGLRTSCGSRLTEGHVAGSDAAVVARLRSAGAIYLGKLALTEFGTGGPAFDLPWPPVRNPWNLDLEAGGSSSGPAAAVAAGLVQLAIGTDTAGSIRAPATLCAVTGMKATYGRVSRAGTFPLAPSLDHVGPLTRTIDDNILALEAMSETAPAGGGLSLSDSVPSIAGLSIGIIRDPDAGAGAAPEQVEAFERAVAVLADLGATLREVRIAPLAEWMACGEAILASEAYAIHRPDLTERPQAYSVRTRSSLARGAAVTEGQIAEARMALQKLIAGLDGAFSEVDALVALSTARLPRRLDAIDTEPVAADTQFRIPFNLAGAPALALPTGFTSEGLPLGMQIVTRKWNEALAYNIGRAYEEATGWTERRPRLPGTENT